VFIDELELMPRPQRFLDIIRDISDISGTPFILIGEKELMSCMKQNKYVWSRVFQQLEFKPTPATEIKVYAQTSTGLELTGEAADLVFAETGGNMRLIRRAMLGCVHDANVQKTTVITDAMAKTVLKRGLTGK
jgi:DNA transposition AAA+ family ATPase